MPTDDNMTQQQLVRQLEESRRRIAELEQLLEARQIPIPVDTSIFASHQNDRATDRPLSGLDTIFRKASLLDFVDDAIVAGDTNFTITMWNKSAERMYGWTAEEVLGRNATELFQTVYENTDLKVAEVIDKYRNQGVWRGEMIHTRKDGSKIPVMGTSAFLRDQEGTVIGSVTVLRDITREKQAQKALRLSEERYRVVSNLMTDYAYMYRVDENGKWHWVWTTEESYQRVTGYYREEVTNDYGLYHPDDVARVREDLQRTLQGESTEGEYRIITKSGNVRWIYIARHAIWDDQQNRVSGFYGAGKDITVRKDAEQQALELASEKERIRVLQDFIRDVSHDLKTPLSTIGITLYMLRKLMETEEQVRHISKLEGQFRHLSSLIEDMFEMSRLDLGIRIEHKAFDIGEYVEHFAIVFRGRAEQRDIQFMHDHIEMGCEISGDTALIGRAITSLLENAMHYTPAGGVVTLACYQDSDHIRIEVQDTGIGIHPHELPHIFDRFYRADKARTVNTGARTGLGLSIARKIVELHGGIITVASMPDEGSTFVIHLPLASTSATPSY